MAHECPTCYFTCHCGGDIGDLIFTETKYETNCTHCNSNDDEWLCDLCREDECNGKCFEL